MLKFLTKAHECGSIWLGRSSRGRNQVPVILRKCDCAFSQFEHLILRLVFANGWWFSKKGLLVLFGCNFLGLLSIMAWFRTFSFFSLLARSRSRSLLCSLFMCKSSVWRCQSDWRLLHCVESVDFVFGFCLARALINAGLIFISAIVQDHEAPQGKFFFEKSYFWSDNSGFFREFGREIAFFSGSSLIFGQLWQFSSALFPVQCTFVLSGGEIRVSVANLKFFSVAMRITLSNFYFFFHLAVYQC